MTFASENVHLLVPSIGGRVKMESLLISSGNSYGIVRVVVVLCAHTSTSTVAV